MLLYVGISVSAAARLAQHAGREWFDRIGLVKILSYPTREEALAAEATAIKTEGPLFNKTGVTRKAPSGKPFGVIRYAIGAGAPETDHSSFDGWYTDRSIAVAVFNDWRLRFPNWVVAIVEMDDAHFPEDVLKKLG